MSIQDKAIKIMEHYPVRLSGKSTLLVFCEETDENRKILKDTFKVEVISHNHGYKAYYTRLNQ